MGVKILLIALCGAAGTLARFGLTAVVQKKFGASFPWGTFTVNVVGAFLFGLIWMLAEERAIISAAWRPYLLTGFLGAFTTFSTYIFESGVLMRDGEWKYALCNVAGQIVAGLVALFLGAMLGRMV